MESSKVESDARSAPAQAPHDGMESAASLREYHNRGLLSPLNVLFFLVASGAFLLGLWIGKVDAGGDVWKAAPGLYLPIFLVAYAIVFRAHVSLHVTRVVFSGETAVFHTLFGRAWTVAHEEIVDVREVSTGYALRVKRHTGIERYIIDPPRFGAGAAEVERRMYALFVQHQEKR
ncbi:MAG: hypothetical protein HY719_03915 [Planctomycetes bacterium]|nr:hypothetical protein [Planctomycetota bacterium]